MENAGEYAEENCVEEEFIDLQDNYNLIKVETQRLIQMKQNHELHIEDLRSTVREAESNVQKHLADLQELQKTHENLTELYRHELENREDTCIRLNQINETTAIMESEFRAIRETIADIRHDKVNIETRFDAKISHFESRVKKIENSFSSYKAKLEKTNLEKDFIIKNLAESAKELKVVSEQKIIQEKELIKLKHTLTQSTEKNQSILQSMEDLKINSEQKLINLQQQYNDLNEKYTELIATKNELIKQIAEQNSTIDLKEITIIDLKQSEDILRKEIQELKANVLELSLEVTQVNESKQLEVNNLTEKICSLENVVSQLTNDKLELNAEVQDYRMDKDNFENQRNVLLDKISMLKTDNSTKQSEIDQLQTEKKDLETKNEQLEYNLTNEKILVEEKQKEFEICESEFVSMKDEMNTKLNTEAERVEKCNSEIVFLREELNKHKEMHKAVLREYQTALEQSEIVSKKKIEEMTELMKEERKKNEKLKAEEIEKMKEQIKEIEIKTNDEIDSIQKKFETCQLDLSVAKQSIKIITRQNENLKSENDTLKRERLHSTGNKRENKFSIDNESDTQSSSASSFYINPDTLQHRLKLMANSQILKRKADCTPSSGSSNKKSSQGQTSQSNSNTEEIESKKLKRRKIK